MLLFAEQASLADDATDDKRYSPLSLDRSWLRRGLFSPAPFGASVTPLWENGTVTFLRSESIDNDYGGFKTDGKAQAYWTTPAYIDMADDVATATTVPGGAARQRVVIFIRTPEDTSLWPRRGDRVRWSDAAGQQYDLPVKAAVWPENTVDHLEIEVEAL